MNTYIITEKQSFYSRRKGKRVKARDLAQAKRIAAKKKVFYSTVLTIATLTGDIVAYRPASGYWLDL